MSKGWRTNFSLLYSFQITLSKGSRIVSQIVRGFGKQQTAHYQGELWESFVLIDWLICWLFPQGSRLYRESALCKGKMLIHTYTHKRRKGLAFWRKDVANKMARKGKNMNRIMNKNPRNSNNLRVLCLPLSLGMGRIYIRDSIYNLLYFSLPSCQSSIAQWMLLLFASNDCIQLKINSHLGGPFTFRHLLAFSW